MKTIIILKRGTERTTASMPEFKKVIDGPLNSLVLNDLLNVYVKADSDFNVVNITQMAKDWSSTEADIVSSIRQLINIGIFIEI